VWKLENSQASFLYH